MFISRDQNAGQSHKIKTDNRTSERVEQLQYVGITLTNQNFIQEEIKSRLKSGKACYHSVQNILSSSLLSKNTRIKIYAIIILLVLYGCATWSLTLTEERRLRVFENRVLRGIFGSKRDEVTGEWRKLRNEALNVLYSHNIVLAIKSGKVRWVKHVAPMGKGAYWVLVGKPERSRPLVRFRRRWQDNIKMGPQEVGWGMD